MDEQTLQQAVTLAQNGQHDQARGLLREVLSANKDNLKAWGVMYQLARSPEEASICLNHVLRLKPGDAWATEQLQALQRPAQPAAAPPPLPTTPTPPPAAPSAPQPSAAPAPADAADLESLIHEGLLSLNAAGFLEVSVLSGIDILVSGDADGRMRLYNALASIAPAGSSLIDNLKYSQIIGWFQSMDEGANGSVVGLQAGNPRGATTILENMLVESVSGATRGEASELIASTLELIVYVDKNPIDEQMVVMQITEIQGLEEGFVTLSDIFAYSELSREIQGQGMRPRCLTKIEAAGYSLPPALFN